MAPKTLATVLTLGITLMRAVPTWAVSARFNLLPIDSLIVQISDSLVNTYIPFISPFAQSISTILNFKQPMRSLSETNPKFAFWRGSNEAILVHKLA
jgi:hypothetical protein